MIEIASSLLPASVAAEVRSVARRPAYQPRTLRDRVWAALDAADWPEARFTARRAGKRVHCAASGQFLQLVVTVAADGVLKQVAAQVAQEDGG